ncbi:hypothetical protein SAMN02910447_02899 [Ruminococcus sp. YE71]|uniref:hypothetical protein n=1 Tax=unclassified Ruminococcus TaxID=2608920 RepID=UPI0008833D2A|nr:MULTISPECIES: hypothetical protein [unclassified Ruminococcus]SDA27864.1 hypothetical protein SAMN02910446_02887 [Ruminococcus sp. YE78]SFW46375.1 hypothetical protein SAMN02910447_02899 [Ruminococcus sp. YE71]
MYHGYIDVPTIAYFEFGNVWSGSLLGTFNYKIIPKSKDEPPVLHVTIWYGTLCLDKSEIAEEFDCPLSEEGYEELIAMLNERIHAYRSETAYGLT